VSIITVVRNGEKHIEQCIQSVLAQTYSPIEHIIVDGASTDGTVDILREYDSRIAYWQSEPDNGIYDAMNKGSQLARGDYALYLNSDDYLYGGHAIETVVQAGLTEAERPLVLAGRIMCAWEEEVLDWQWPPSEAWIQKYRPTHQATLLASDIYKAIPYNPGFRIAADADLWERIRLSGLFRLRYVDTVVSVFRLGGACSNASKMEYYGYLEQEISRYLNHQRFSLFRVLLGAVAAGTKIAARRILGPKIYYRYLLYGIHRLRKRVV
jgi:glycosyltransferase involved in cell wall biosynthesis